MKNPSNKYWIDRAATRMVDYMAEAEITSNKIGRAYYNASNYVGEEVKKIFKNFQKSYNITEDEAVDLILKSPNSRSVKNMLLKLAGKTSDEEKRLKILADIASPAYAYRIKRLELLLKDVESNCNVLYKTQLDTSVEFFKSLAPNAYYRTMFDIQKGVGAAFSFNSMPVGQINKILATNWSGEHFSSRIWGNTTKFAEDLRQELLTAFMTGKPYNKTAETISNMYSAEAFNARRLVRTEANYIANQAELDSYRECGIDKYRFISTLDMRTSEMCAVLDNKEFYVKDGVPGVNMPPMHPFCRSTTVAVIDGETIEGMQRRARDPETGKTYLVPADMNYNEWRQKHIDEPKEKEYNIFKERVHKDIKNNYKLSVNQGRQDKHIKGTNNYIEGRSILKYDAQSLIDMYAGKSEPLQITNGTRKGEWNEKEKFNHTSEIGMYIDINGNQIKTNRGIIHYSKNKGVHIVPDRPKEK